MSSTASEPFIRWTTPLRRKGNQELWSIPNEIYIEIISYFDLSELDDYWHYQRVIGHYKKDLGSLGLVCRLFHSITLPILFRTIRVKATSDGPQGQSLVSHTAFLQSLTEGTDPMALSAGTYVQKYTLENYIDRKSFAEHLDDLYAAALLKMRNINTLTVSCTNLSSILLNNISQLSNLTSLILLQCSLRDLSTSDIVTLTSRVRLRSLVFSPWEDVDHQEALENFSMSDLVPLAANSHLRVLSTSSWKFLQCLTTAEIAAPLILLTLYDVRDPVSFASYLSRLTTLERLSVVNMDWPNQTQIPSKLVLSDFPKLRYLNGPSHLVYFFTGPHFLRSIRLHLSYNPSVRTFHLEKTMLMERPNNTVLQLNLPYVALNRDDSVEWLGKLQMWFPNLEKLGVDISEFVVRDGFANIFKNLIDSWGPQNTLTEWNLKFNILSDVKYEKVEHDMWFRDMIATLKVEENYPKLAHFEISGSSFQGSWDKDEVGNWR